MVALLWSAIFSNIFVFSTIQERRHQEKLSTKGIHLLKGFSIFLSFNRISLYFTLGLILSQDLTCFFPFPSPIDFDLWQYSNDLVVENLFPFFTSLWHSQGHVSANLFFGIIRPQNLKIEHSNVHIFLICLQVGQVKLKNK